MHFWKMNMEKSNNTNHIKFTSNPVYSFYGLYRHCMQNPEMATNAIKGFENENKDKKQFFDEKSKIF